MGLSVAKDELYYIYVLRVEGNGWYVGSTQSFERRMRSHFGKGGAVATKERRALEIEEVFELRDYQIRTDCAHERAEVLTARGPGDDKWTIRMNVCRAETWYLNDKC